MQQTLPKSLNLFTLTMIAAGSCIGGGIFISPSDVAGQVQNGGQVIWVWLMGGLVTVTGALTFAELASRISGTGGVYLMIKEAYGRLAAFLYGWCTLTVITSGAIAALCLAFSRFSAIIFGFPESWQLPIALTLLFTITIINSLGVKFGATMTNMTTVIKIIGIAMIVIVALLFGSHFTSNFSGSLQPQSSTSFGLALVGVLWAFGGWHHATYVSGEAKKVSDVPKALLMGAVIVTLCYCSVNASYLHLLPFQELIASKTVATDALLSVTTWGGKLIAVLISIATLGSVAIFTMSTPRVYYQMGKDKTFISWLGKVNSKFQTPLNAILLQSAWASVLMILWGTFENLVTYVVFTDIIFMTLAAISIFILRKKNPEYKGYKVLLYPFIPLIYIGITIYFLISTLLGRPEQAIAGLVLLAIGCPIYYVFTKSQHSKVPEI